MLAPLKWLKDYVEIDISLKEFEEKVTMSGTKVEGIQKIGEDINNVVVGKILEINPHPDADKLVVTKVDLGDEIVQIVTGANNISENDYVPIAKIGANLPGDFKIKKSKLRGIESYGMMCSAQELSMNLEGLPEEQTIGIYILDKPYPLGKDIKEVLGLDETIIEFELTNNRPDCISMVGIAREVAATLGKPLVLPLIEVKKEQGDIKEYIDVSVEDSKLCPRYMGKIIKDVKIGPSPKWMQDRLTHAGVRAINNIVDVTNYVMLETGQPLHAFDYNKLEEHKIVVRRAKEGEEITTLDDVKRELDSSMLVIADAHKPIAIAGVMGGGNSEIDDNTTTIVLEAANFEGDNIRQTAKSVGLRTEASSKYEKAIDPSLVEIAMNRAAQLLEEINAGTVVGGHVDYYQNPINPHIITIDPKWINRFIGVNMTTEEIINCLEPLEMEAVEVDSMLTVTIPTFRQDVQLPEDLAEEIARIYGYDNIPSTMMKGITVEGKKSYKQKLEKTIKNLLVAQGGYETFTYSFTSPQVYDKLKISLEDNKRDFLRLINPLGEENSVMRTTIIGNMMQLISYNINHNIEQGFFFEVGNIYCTHEPSIKDLPNEIKTLTIGMYGDIDFFDLKGVVENLLDISGISKYEFEVISTSTFHPGRSAQISHDGEVLGVFGEIHPDVEENYDVDQRIYIAEINFDLLNEKSNLEKQFKELPKYPATTRDIALLLKKDIPVREIEKIIEMQNSNIIESYCLFDVYQGEQIPEGYKSIAYSIVYRGQDTTLTDKRVNKVHNKIVKDLQVKLDAQLRE